MGPLVGSPRTGNLVLDLLTPEDRGPLVRGGTLITVPPGTAIYRQDEPLDFVYFPTVGAFSVLVGMEDGRAIEAVLTGTEGMLGVPLFLGANFSPSTVVSHQGAEALRLPARDFLQEARPGSVVDRLLRRYILYSSWFAKQSVGCSLLHPVEKRLCRWLLTAQDHARSEVLLVTHEVLAELLGVRRQTITVVAGELLAAGHITYGRGNIRIVNRPGLLGATCECYRSASAFYEHIMQRPL